MVDPALARRVGRHGRRLAVASVPLLPQRRTFLPHHRDRCDHDRVVPAALARPDVLLDDAAPAPDVRGAQELGHAELAGLARRLRLHDVRQLVVEPLADLRPGGRIHQEHPRLEPSADRDLLCPRIPVSGRASRGPLGSGNRSRVPPRSPTRYRLTCPRSRNGDKALAWRHEFFTRWHRQHT